MISSDLVCGIYAEIMREYMKNQTKKGLIYIFTGNGKGKTSAALGMMTRGLAHGWKVGWISWYKEKSWGISEHAFVDLLNSAAKKRLQFFPMGKGFFLKKQARRGKVKTAPVNTAVVVDDDSEAAHKQAAHQALRKAAQLMKQVDLLILDELCNAVGDGLLTQVAVLELLKKRGATHVVLTGRDAKPGLQRVADLVSSIAKTKHPFDRGQNAVKGLDF